VQSSDNTAGFTIIELSIVLVLISLIIGGVLTGQDLIQAAKLRATVSEYEHFNTAVDTFTLKYNGLPGDLQSSTAEVFGFTYTTSCTVGCGDGDGYIGPSTWLASPEGILFWTHLYQANLISNALAPLPAGAWTVSDAVASSIPALFPITKLAGGTYFWAAAFTDGFNYYAIGPLATFPASSGGPGPTMTAAQGLSALMAYALDVKIDDGVPNAGIVQSINSSTGGYATLVQGGASGTCINATNSAAYSGGTAAAAKLPYCQLRLRFN
jgi:prepilin-type N-terminal cleavage/methylation domain-containing protein